MHLFSKRHGRNIDLPDAIKSRLKIQMSHCLYNGFFEGCFLRIEDEGRNISPNTQLLYILSKGELGYSLEDEFDTDTLELQISDSKNNNHGYLFDFIELMIIFCKPEKRDDFIGRIRYIFDEEGELFVIHNYLVVPNTNNGLKPILPFLKDAKLRSLIISYYQIKETNPEYSSLAKISASILNYLFSSIEGKDKTRNYSEELCRKLSSKFSPEKSDELYTLINSQVLSAKNFNNNIDDVRHTEKHTIGIIKESGIYRYIADNNMNMIELVITGLPEDYISDGDSETVKANLISTYSIKKDTSLVFDAIF